jgi:HK97 family phage major capsid protein
MIKVPRELLQDSAVDVEALLRSALAERAGRITNEHLTTGDGSTQPQGIVTASTLGKTAAAAVAFTSNEILDLIHSVDPAYRPNARLMFHDTTLKAILQLTDSQNRPLFQPSNRDGAPATVHGYRFSINNDMAVPAAAARFMLFGDFKYLLFRRAAGFDLLRLNERFAEANQVAFVGFWRMDSKFIDASGGAVKYMRNA